MKSIATLFVLFSFSTAFGQTEKGNLLIGGSSDLTFGSNNTIYQSDSDNYTDPGNTFYLFLSPRVGYFLVDNWVIGLSIPAGVSFGKNDISKSRNFNLGVGPFTRYYFGSGIVRPVIEGGVAFGAQNTKITNQNNQSNNTRSISFSGNGGVGAVVFLTESVSIDGILSYTHFRQTPDDSPDNLVVKTNQISFNIGISIFF